MFKSVIETRGAVVFPEFLAERVYMREFYKGKLPEDLKRWGDTVDAMLDGIDTDGPIYLMVDESVITAGSTHRRKGLHIDGYWNPGISAHGNSHLPFSPPGHGGGRRHGSISAHEGGTHSDSQWHGSKPPIVKIPNKKSPKSKIPWGEIRNGHMPVYKHHSAGNNTWEESTFNEHEAIILASSLSAARGYVGDFLGPIKDGGDCSHIDLSNLTEIKMQANEVYACNVTGLHESIPVDYDCVRQLVRLNVPGWSPLN